MAIAMGLVAPAYAQQSAVITNTGRLSFMSAGGATTVTSNTTTLTVTARKAPRIFLMRLAFASSGGITLNADGGQCLVTGKGYVDPDVDNDDLFNASAVVLRQSATFHAGEPVFIDYIAPDSNTDPNRRELVDLTVRTGQGDVEKLRLAETDVNSGRFLGFIEATDDNPPTPEDCQLSAPRGETLTVTVDDPYDDSFDPSASALIDPYGFVFDARTGEPVDGARVTLVDEATGEPANVVGDDGVSVYPSTVISGEDLRDAAGSLYHYGPGQYRFPLAPAGRYRLFIEPPAGYSAPSTATAAEIAKLQAPDGVPFMINAGSWGQPFDLVDADPLKIDIPMDSGRLPRIARAFVTGLSLEKSVATDKAAFGDIVRYTLSARNLGAGRTINDVTIEDNLPRGFRYVPGSSKLDGVTMADPKISTNGTQLTYALGMFSPSRLAQVSYLVTVGADTPVGYAINRAIARGALGASSGMAEAKVRVSAPLMTDAATLIGRVTENTCKVGDKTPGPGVAGIRILMEDGTFVASDRDGLFHFEGVRPGIHVVQLDVGSLPPGLEAVACGDDTRMAGRAFSQFVDLKAGALWRVEFRLRRTAAAVVPTPTGADQGAALAEDGVVDWFAGQTPGVGWVFPGEGHNPRAPAIRVAVKHQPGQHVELLLNGKPVDSLARDGVETSADGAMSVALWRGVPLTEGSNSLVAKVTDARGVVIAELKRDVAYANTPAKATFVAKGSHLAADGLTAPVIAVRFTDRFGNPVRAGSMGSLDIAAPYAAAMSVDEESQRVAGEARRATTWRVTGDDGVALITLAPTTQAGPVTLKFTLPGASENRPAEVRAWLSADREKWVVVGFAAGTAGFNTLSRNVAPLEDPHRGKRVVDGQLAFYAKGRVKGSWLLTVAYDNKPPVTQDRGLLSTIDPDRYYTVYGDGSTQGYDAATQNKLYLRLERRDFYALFGDFQTGFDSTQLGRFDRTMNGAKFERQGKVLNFSGFAASTEQSHIRDELPGSGLAGLYQLSRRNVVPNTETIIVETRDRARSERILASRTLSRDIDYSLDQVSGALTLREPVLSYDANLNPNVIVASYEVLGNGEKTTEAGARVSATLADGKIKAGVTYLHGRPGDMRAEADLVAADLVLRPRVDTQVRLEAAATQAGDANRQTAWLAEIDHHSSRVDVLAYARQADETFGLGQQNIGELGARKIGVDGKARLTNNLTVSATGYHENYLTSGDSRDVVDAKLDYTHGDTRLSAGLKSAHDQTSTNASANSDLLTLGASRDFMNRRLQVSASTDIALGGKAESLDFPVRHRVGAAFELREGVRLLASHEIIEGADYRAAVTRGGVEFAPWKGARLTSALNQQDLSAFGPRTYGQLGLNQTVRLKGGWSLDASVDTSSTLAGKAPEQNTLNPAAVGSALSTEDFTAVSLGAAYRAELWSWNGRAEARRGDRSDSWALRTAYLRQLREGVTAAVTARADETKTSAAAVSRGYEVAGSLAWRPLDSRWSVLNKLELRGEFAHGVVQGVHRPGYGATARSDGDTTKLINNLAINYDSDRGDHRKGAVQASLYHGVKLVRGRFDGETRDNIVQIIGAEARWDVSQRVDVGLNLALRHAPKGGQVAYTFGPSVGLSPAKNTWISVGWNVVGFNDRDFESAGYTRQGGYITARIKFDQMSLAGLTQAFRGGGR